MDTSDSHLTCILVAVSSLCLCPIALATEMRACFYFSKGSVGLELYNQSRPSDWPIVIFSLNFSAYSKQYIGNSNHPPPEKYFRKYTVTKLGLENSLV